MLGGESRPGEDSHDSLHDFLERVRPIRDQHGTQGGAGDNHQFGWLQEDQDVAFLQQIAPDHRAEDHQNSHNCKHVCRRP